MMPQASVMTSLRGKIVSKSIHPIHSSFARLVFLTEIRRIGSKRQLAVKL